MMTRIQCLPGNQLKEQDTTIQQLARRKKTAQAKPFFHETFIKHKSN